MQNLAIVPAFEDPVSQAQKTFRCLLKAMSEPGVIVELPPVAALRQLYPATHAVCLSLLDSRTPLWLSDGLADPQVRHNLHFHTGMPLATDAATARFALAQGNEMDTLAGFPRGTLEYPERGCTLIIQVAALARHSDVGPGFTCLQLSGPGIDGRRQLALDGLCRPLIEYLVERPDPFPLGLDFMFTDVRSLVAIPRTTQVEVC